MSYFAAKLPRKPTLTLIYSSQYYSTSSPDQGGLAKASNNLERFLGSVLGRKLKLESIRAKTHSFFVSLTVADVNDLIPSLSEVIVGSDAVELRVDLLQDKRRPNSLPSEDYVAHQLSVLRGSCGLPIIFTIRTQSQAGKFPDDARDEALSLYILALRMGVDFLDLEMQFPEPMLKKVSSMKGFTRIIASHHDPKGVLDWDNGSWIPYFNKALLYGDVIKLVGVAKSQNDNITLHEFKSWANAAHATPLIAINMGVDGQLSRIQNSFLTPVSHPALPFKAAPGQLSARDIRVALSLHGVIKPKKYYLVRILKCSTL